MSNEAAVSFFFGYDLRERLEFSSISRLNNMKKNVELINDMIFNSVVYIHIVKYKSPLQRIFEIVGINGSGGCIFCKVGTYHHCVMPGD